MVSELQSGSYSSFDWTVSVYCDCTQTTPGFKGGRGPCRPWLQLAVVRWVEGAPRSPPGTADSQLLLWQGTVATATLKRALVIAMLSTGRGRCCGRRKRFLSGRWRPTGTWSCVAGPEKIVLLMRLACLTGESWKQSYVSCLLAGGFDVWENFPTVRFCLFKAKIVSGMRSLSLSMCLLIWIWLLKTWTQKLFVDVVCWRTRKWWKLECVF